MSTDSWPDITLRVRTASIVCILLVCRCMDHEGTAKWHSYQWQAWPCFPVKLTWAETPELHRQRRSQRRPTLPALPQRCEIWETSQWSAKHCAAQWGRSSASSLWHSHRAWLSLAVTSSGAVLNCKSRKSEHFICYTQFIQADTWRLSRNSKGKLLQLVLRLVD